MVKNRNSLNRSIGTNFSTFTGLIDFLGLETFKIYIKIEACNGILLFILN